jgi:hypothetical protein
VVFENDFVTLVEKFPIQAGFHQFSSNFFPSEFFYSNSFGS